MLYVGVSEERVPVMFLSQLGPAIELNGLFSMAAEGCKKVGDTALSQRKRR